MAEKEIEEPRGEGIGQSEVNKIAKVEREMEELRSDVNTISEDLKNVVSELKKSIVDVRSAVSEIENPFNLLRIISSDKDLKRLNSERLGRTGVQTLALEKPEEKPEEKITVSPVLPELPREEAPALEEEGREEEKALERPPPTPPPKKGLGYLDWVWSLLESDLNSGDITELARSYEFMGYLPVGSSGYVHSLAIAAEKARSKHFSKDDLMLNMYKAATISGVTAGLEDVTRLISIAENKVQRKPRQRT